MNEQSPVDVQKSDISEEDALSRLHRMSRTAGLGTQEYVAVNATAVAGLILGLASSAAVLADVLLIVPAAAIIVSMIAIVQVRRSGGTQTGTGLAGIGLLLALVFLGWVGGQAWMRKQEIQREQGEIVALVDTLSKNVISHQYDAAYQQFSPLFQSWVSKESFIRTWEILQNSLGYGPIKGIRWNTRLEMQLDPETGARIANGVILVDTAAGGEPDRWPAVFRKYEDKGWLIENIDTGYFVKVDPNTIRIPFRAP